MSDLTPQYNNQTPDISVPQERSEASITYPVYGPEELDRKKKLFLMMPEHLGRPSKHIGAAWSTFLDQWEAACLGLWTLRQQQSEHGTLPLGTALRQAQADAAYELEICGEPAPVSSDLFVKDNLLEILDMVGEHKKEIELNNLTTKHSEVFWTRGVKILFVVPQLMLFCQAVHFDPTRSLVLGLFLLVAAFALTNAYQLVARPVIECLATLNGKPTDQYGDSPLRKGAVITHLVIFATGFLAAVSLAMFLDGTVFYISSQMDIFGKKNPLAFNFPTALAIAGSFSGMLALASLVIAWNERNVAETIRMVEAKVAELTQKVAPAFRNIREIEGELKAQVDREAEVNARFVSAWVRFCTTIYLMSKNVSDAAIVRYLVLPHSPFEADAQHCTNAYQGIQDKEATPKRFGFRWLRASSKDVA